MAGPARHYEEAALATPAVPIGESRTLASGRAVACEAEPRTLTIETRCPAKWAMVDLETGDIWVHDPAIVWRRGRGAIVDELAAVVVQAKRDAALGGSGPSAFDEAIPRSTDLS